MNTGRPWLRVSGRLADDLTFVPETGWETSYVAQSLPPGDGTFMVDAVDAQGEVLVDAAPQVRFEPSQGLGANTAHIVAYLPLVPGTRRVRLRRGRHVIFRRDVAEAPPTLHDVVAEVTAARTLRVSWRSEPGRGATPDLVHRVAWVAEGRGVFPLSGDLQGSGFEIPISRVPGTTAGRVAVLASDGLRSQVSLSEPLALPLRPARVVVTEPAVGARYPFGQPLMLRGAAFDDAGARLDAVGLTWALNGQPVAVDERNHLVLALPPGEHHVILEWEGAGAPRAEARTRFVVLPPPPTGLSPIEPITPERPPEDGPLRIRL